VNKEALLADRAELLAPELRKVGLKIVQEERFYITPHGPLSNAGQAMGEEEWREAA
jgi:hypothetical protein